MNGKRKPSLDLDLDVTYPPTPDGDDSSDSGDAVQLRQLQQQQQHSAGGKVAFSIHPTTQRGTLLKSLTSRLTHLEALPPRSHTPLKSKSKLAARERKGMRAKARTWDTITFPPVPAFPEYEFVNSPDDASSTSSSEYASSYVRTPGFDHHGHTFVEEARQRIRHAASDGECEEDEDDLDEHHHHSNTTSTKKKRNSVLNDKCDKKKGSVDVKGVQSAILIRSKPKKDPLPMKLRALPQSFWQQPNNTNVLSPGTVYPVLPPLANNSRELTPPEDRHEGVVSDANTDLLFSLFHGVEAEQRKIQGKPLVTIVKRGRPKKPPSSLSKTALKDDDPCLVSSVTEAILPLLPPEKVAPNSLQARIAEGQQVLAMVSLNGDRSNVSLPILNVDHNYSQILSELVVQL